jgi:hypothetical protein
MTMRANIFLILARERLILDGSIKGIFLERRG